jgi:hypothetical protein
MTKIDGFNWKLDESQNIKKLQDGVYLGGESISNRKIFFANVEVEKNLGFEVIDSFVCFCNKIEEKTSPWFWVKIESNDIHKYLVETLNTDMAYQNELIEKEECKMLADQFLKQFAVPTDYISFYSNFAWDSNTQKPSSSGFGVTGATFDRLIIGLTGTRIGMLQAEDED